MFVIWEWVFLICGAVVVGSFAIMMATLCVFAKCRATDKPAKPLPTIATSNFIMRMNRKIERKRAQLYAISLGLCESDD